jgi:hypothetical protein
LLKNENAPNNCLDLKIDVPPNSLRNPNVVPKMKQASMGKKRKSWGMLLNSSHFEGRKACWSFENNSQVKVQDEVNLHNQ